MKQFTYKGIDIDGKLYKYNKKYRVAEVENNNCMYFLQQKKLFKWQTISFFNSKELAISTYNMIKQRRKIKLKIIKGD